MTLIQSEDWQPQGVDTLETRAWEALRCVNQSVLVTAGAGAGKTEFLAQKATYLLQTGICPAPKRILAICFKRDAAFNLRQRVEKRCPPEQARRFNSYTFDAFAKNLLDRFSPAIPSPFSPTNDYRIILPGRRDYEEFLERNGFNFMNAQQLEREISSTCLPINGEDEYTKVVAKYWHEQYNNYQEVLLSFAMINRLVELCLRENLSIKHALQLTYPFVFLDEFQDTTSAQFELLCTAFNGSTTLFTAVGDDKQRIMGWAGAMTNAFGEFRQTFAADRISLLSNWRSHDELVRIQHIIARHIDSEAEVPQARGKLTVDGDISAIWNFSSEEEEAEIIATWIDQEIKSRNVKPHEIAILVRSNANNVEEHLTPLFSNYGLRLRNEARNIGEISIQDLLGENLVEFFLPFLRLGTLAQSPDNWTTAFQYLEYLEAIDPEDEIRQQQLQYRLQFFVGELRKLMKNSKPNPKAAGQLALAILDFITESRLRQTVPGYQRKQDFDRVWDGFISLLCKCAESTESWSDTLDEFIGLGQVPLMTIHKSKGLEFHTMIFYGLDNNTWWSLRPDRPEELNTFFVAFTRAEQRAFFSLCHERGDPVSWIEEILEPSDVCYVDGDTIIST